MSLVKSPFDILESKQLDSDCSVINELSKKFPELAVYNRGYLARDEGRYTVHVSEDETDEFIPLPVSLIGYIQSGNSIMVKYYDCNRLVKNILILDMIAEKSINYHNRKSNVRRTW